MAYDITPTAHSTALSSSSHIPNHREEMRRRSFTGRSWMSRAWTMEEEENDDLEFLFDDDAEQATMLAQLQAGEEGSSRRGPRPPKVIRPRDHEAGDERIHKHYFDAKPVYNDFQFRRRYGTST